MDMSTEPRLDPRLKVPNGVTVPVRNGVSVNRFRSQDIDETRVHVRDNYGEHSRVIHGRGPFLYEANIVGTDRVATARTVRWLSQTLRAAVQHPTLFVSPEPSETVRMGRRSFTPDTSRDFFAAPDQEYVRQGPMHRYALVLRIHRDLVERAIDERRRGRSRRWVLRNLPLPSTPARREELIGFFASVRAAAMPDGTWGGYGDAAGFDAAVAGWLAEQLLEVDGARPTTEANLQRIVRLEQWVDAHLGEDLSLDAMCGVIGVSRRSLQKALLLLRGQTPIEFVTSRRLTAARGRLENRASTTQVATVALDCGFRHLGRFAANYRKAFGESPSETARATRLIAARPAR